MDEQKKVREMTQMYTRKEEEEFSEAVQEAFTKDFITEIQKRALLAKYKRKFEGEPLTTQDRNALRILRNNITHNQNTITEHAKYALKFDTILELLSVMDKRSGIYCHVCKDGLLIKRTVSSWIIGSNYELILEQKPAQVCSNSACKTTSFSLEVEEQEEQILNEVEKQLRTIRTTKPEEFNIKKCPLCRSEALEAKHTGDVYKYRQGLYHIKIKDVPLKAYCTICHYQEVGENVTVELEKIESLLDAETLELLKLDG